MSNLDAPLGPTHTNVTNFDGTTLSYFQRSDQRITPDTVSTVFNALQNSQLIHETSLQDFTTALGNCGYFVQGYDNSQLVCFGAIRILSTEDLGVLNIPYPDGFGALPFGVGAFGGGFPYRGKFGELSYLWCDPAYRNSPNNLYAKLTDLLVSAQRDFIDPPTSRQLFFTLPSGVSFGTGFPLNDWIHYLTNPTQYFSQRGGTQSQFLVSGMNVTPEYNPTFTGYHNISGQVQVYNVSL